jgi:hypothetical protein
MPVKAVDVSVLAALAFGEPRRDERIDKQRQKAWPAHLAPVTSRRSFDTASHSPSASLGAPGSPEDLAGADIQGRLDPPLCTKVGPDKSRRRRNGAARSFDTRTPAARAAQSL